MRTCADGREVVFFLLASTRTHALYKDLHIECTRTIAKHLRCLRYAERTRQHRINLKYSKPIQYRKQIHANTHKHRQTKVFVSVCKHTHTHTHT